MDIGQAPARWNSGRPLGSLRFTGHRKRGKRCWICKWRTRRLRKQYSPQAGELRSASLHSVCLPVAVSTFVAKFGNFNCRWREIKIIVDHTLFRYCDEIYTDHMVKPKLQLSGTQKHTHSIAKIFDHNIKWLSWIVFFENAYDPNMLDYVSGKVYDEVKSRVGVTFDWIVPKLCPSRSNISKHFQTKPKTGYKSWIESTSWNHELFEFWDSCSSNP